MPTAKHTSERAVIQKDATVVDTFSHVPAWSIRVNGRTKVVTPSSEVIIGRKPIRPVASDGVERIDVADSTKSMSKKHALFSVDTQGQARITDLDSTNGSYIVSDDGKLLRIAPQASYVLNEPHVAIQLGDVPVFCDRVEHTAYDSEPSDSSTDHDGQPAEVKDLFSYKPILSDNDNPAANMSVDDILDLRAGEPTGLFSTLSAQKVVDEVEEVEPEAESAVEFVADSSVVPTDEPAVETVHVSELTQALSDEDKVSETESLTELEESTQTDSSEASSQEQHVANRESGEVVQAEVIDESFVQTHDEVSHEENNSPARDELQDNVAVYEAGSVFDRLSKGEFNSTTPVIEVGGHTSNDAQSTRDFNQQFAIAQIPQLVPFLALNPYLYDDMYQWLEALGDADVDTALAHNDGYRTWKARD